MAATRCSSDCGTAFRLPVRRRPFFPLSFICFSANICLTRHTLLCRITLPQPVHNMPIRRARLYGARCTVCLERISANFSEKKFHQGRAKRRLSPCLEKRNGNIAIHRLALEIIHKCKLPLSFASLRKLLGLLLHSKYSEHLKFEPTKF